jgi:hypothetical protein
MGRWIIVAHEDFPIWTVVSRLIERERMEDGKVKWLVEAPEYLEVMPRSARGIISVEPAEAEVEKKAA